MIIVPRRHVCPFTDGPEAAGAPLGVGGSLSPSSVLNATVGPWVSSDELSFCSSNWGMCLGPSVSTRVLPGLAPATT